MTLATPTTDSSVVQQLLSTMDVYSALWASLSL